jgi:hypothetical protein
MGRRRAAQPSFSMRRFVEEIFLSGLILLCAAVAPNIFPAAQAAYAQMSTLALWGLIPSVVVMAAAVGFAKWRGHRRLVNRVWVGIAAGLLATVGLEAVRITSFRVFHGMPGDLPKLLGVLLLNRFMAGPSALSTVLGYLYHFWNGACFGIIFAVIFGRVRFYWGILYGEVIGTVFLLSPAVTALGVGFFASNMHSMQITVWLAHLVYGAILGWLCQCWTPRSIQEKERFCRTLARLRCSRSSFRQSPVPATEADAERG